LSLNGTKILTIDPGNLVHAAFSGLSIGGRPTQRFPRDLDALAAGISGTYSEVVHLPWTAENLPATQREGGGQDSGGTPMGSTQPDDIGPDLATGISIESLSDGDMLLGHVDKDPVLLARRGDKFFAVDAACSHYGGPLTQGLMVGETVRCPWHHACFSLRTGEALHPPALSPLACWTVEQRDNMVVVRQRTKKPPGPKRSPGAARADESPDKIVIIGGGAAGFAAAERLRREQWQGSIVMLSDDDAVPVDRPNLSKDYLAGSAPEDWIPLRPDSYYPENDIELRLNVNVTDIDVRAGQVALSNGDKIPYDRLLLATGAEPVRLTIPGADLPHVRVLRSLADCRTIIKLATTARQVVVLGASFIGLEVAAALRARGIEVHVVAPDKRPMERILGPQMGDFVRALHEEHGVVFHLEDTAGAIEANRIMLKSGQALTADLVVAGVGVRPRTQLAERAGIALDRGVLVDSYLKTSVPQIFAAGDIARWPDPHSGANIRVEHWVVAEREGQTAALNMLGRREQFTAVPFFWSQHYDVPINYVGHAEQWDDLTIDGDIAARDCLLSYKSKGRLLAVASIYRDLESLKTELVMERNLI
jgi:NADPH-dependent 2,4-dienoyl-CoA reductase/sulfur reductase-like enzyme/nitrite reductase/ring-hydroxylating ferredoxin subunit